MWAVRPDGPDESHAQDRHLPIIYGALSCQQRVRPLTSMPSLWRAERGPHRLRKMKVCVANQPALAWRGYTNVCRDPCVEVLASAGEMVGLFLALVAPRYFLCRPAISRFQRSGKNSAFSVAASLAASISIPHATGLIKATTTSDRSPAADATCRQESDRHIPRASSRDDPDQ